MKCEKMRIIKQIFYPIQTYAVQENFSYVTAFILLVIPWNIGYELINVR